MIALWSPSDLLRATSGLEVAQFAATGVSIDTRTLRPGELFVALVGEHGDGHAHVREALEKGAAGAVVHQAVPDVDESRLLRVPDTLVGLVRLAIHGRARFEGRVVAVTGSVGKTTAKEMLRTILSSQGETHAALASHNNHWGVPLTLARLPPEAMFGVVEIGMNHPGEIEPLARLARPHVALITAVERAHIGHMGSIEAIADEKAAITRGLEPDGVVVLPRASPHFARLCQAAEGARVLSFGASAAADGRLLAADADANGTIITAAVRGSTLRFRLNAPGRHMVMNALGALTAAAALGADPVAGARALQGFAPMPGRGARREIAVPGGRALLLDESYNASAASVRAALDVLRAQSAARRLAVLGDMLELGDEGPSEHAGLARDVGEVADLLFACGPLMRNLYDAVPTPVRGAYAEDAASLAAIVARSVKPEDAILVKGSLGSRMKLVIAALDGLAEAR